MAGTSTRVTFTLTIKDAAPGTSVHIVGDHPHLGAGSKDAGIKLVLIEGSNAESSAWTTEKPITLARGETVRYRYGLFENGNFKQWEHLPGSDFRLCTPFGRTVAHEDLWGKVDDDIQQELGTASVPTFSAEAETGVKERLTSVFGTDRKLFIITDTLPLRLRASGPRGTGRTWTARWIEDDIRARTPNSIAYDINTVWVGIVTRDCIELPGGESDVGVVAGGVSPCIGDGASAPAVAAGTASTGEGGLRPLIKPLTGGGVNGLVFDDLLARCGLPTPTHDLGERLIAPSDPAKVTLPDLTQEDREGITAALNAINVVPVFLPPALQARAGEYYQAVLKPCMHNVLDTGSQVVYPPTHSLDLQAQGWAALSAANEAVARTVMRVFSRDDVAWIHDYGLSMVPHHLLRLCQKAHEGRRPAMVFYMHAPFPTSEIFRTLHVRDEILHALLECDMVGFHTFNYARHFLHAAKRLLGVASRTRRGGSLALDVVGREVLVGISHVGVEASALDAWMASDAAAAVARHFHSLYKGKVIIAGFDSCQRLSGLALKLVAFEKLLDENPVYVRKIVLVQRCDIRGALDADFAVTSSEIRSRVVELNAKFAGEAGGDVVDYLEAPWFSPHYRVGLFHRADVLLETPIREGLNMLSLEYTYVRTRWQVMRSAALAGGGGGSSFPGPVGGGLDGRGGGATMAALAGAVSGGQEEAGGSSSSATSNTGLVLDAVVGMSSPIPLMPYSEGGEGYGYGGGADSVTASLEAMYGMPAHYATLAAPPSVSKSTGSGRPSLRSSLPASFKERGSGVGSSEGLEAQAGAGQEGAALGALPSLSSPHSSSTASSAGGPLTSPPHPLPHPGVVAMPVPTAMEQAAFHGPAIPIPLDDAHLTAPLPPPPRGGCVILSEFSMASNILNSNLVVNPWSIRQVSREIDKALLMPDHERSFRQWRDYQYAIQNPSASWSRSCISDVVELRAEREAERLAAAGDAGRLPREGKGLPVLDVTEVVRAYRCARRRALFIDYGGTLVGRDLARAGVSYKQDFHLDGYSAAVAPEAFSAMEGLSAGAANTVYVVSGLRSAAVDVLTLARLPRLGLAAENGMYVAPPSSPSTAHAGAGGGGGNPIAAFAATRNGGGAEEAGASLSARSTGSRDSRAPLARSNSVRHGVPQSPAVRVWSTLLPPESEGARVWERLKARAMAIATEYSWRVNGSTVRAYDSMLVWDYRNADAEWARAQAVFLGQELEDVAAEGCAEGAGDEGQDAGDNGRRKAQARRSPVTVSVRKARVEFALSEMNKGRVVRETLRQLSAGGSSSSSPDFVLCVGDDTTDEDMFKAAHAWAAAGAGTKPTVFTVTVGRKAESGTAAAAYCVDVPAVHALLVALAQAEGEGGDGKDVAAKA